MLKIALDSTNKIIEENEDIDIINEFYKYYKQETELFDAKIFAVNKAAEAAKCGGEEGR